MQIRKTVSRILTLGLLISIGAVSGLAQKRASAQSTPTATVGAADEVAILKQQLAEQQKQIEALQTAMSSMKQQMDHASSAAAPSTKSQSVGEVASTTPVIPRSVEKSRNASETLSVAGPLGAPAVTPVPKEGDEASPRQVRIGTATIMPVGFLDFPSEFRSHNGGSGIGTNFASIPYGTVANTNLSEFRLSMQNSRIGFRVDADVKGAHVIGYMESDFLGNNPGNVAVSSNSNTMRSRLYWVDVRKDKWEVLGGQTWSLITPGRNGISPFPADLFFTENIDVNYQLGLFWGRIPELRVVFHPSKKVAAAIALDSPEQYIGGSAGGGAITLPTALATPYAGELNTGANTLGVPNVAPDVIAKVAIDPTKRFHGEIGGVFRAFKVWNPNTTSSSTAEGGGGFVNANLELVKGFRLFTNNFISDGGGRYIFGQAPDLIAHADGTISLIHADSTVSGLEFTHKNNLVYAYYGGLYVGRNTAIDTNKKLVGYGYAGSPNGQNRAIQEATFGFSHRFWRDPKYGTLAFMGQYSYLTRNPWSVASGQPLNASLNMVFFNLRYNLPGSAPTIGH